MITCVSILLHFRWDQMAALGDIGATGRIGLSGSVPEGPTCRVGPVSLCDHSRSDLKRETIETQVITYKLDRALKTDTARVSVASFLSDFACWTYLYALDTRTDGANHTSVRLEKTICGRVVSAAGRVCR